MPLSEEAFEARCAAVALPRLRIASCSRLRFCERDHSSNSSSIACQVRFRHQPAIIGTHRACAVALRD